MIVTVSWYVETLTAPIKSNRVLDLRDVIPDSKTTAFGVCPHFATALLVL